MIPTVIYGALHGHAPVETLVDTRIYRDFAGDAPTAPYVVWTLLTTVPDNHLSGAPPSDRYSVAVDVFAESPADADALVIAARDAMETIGQLSSGPQSLGRDESTHLWRYTFTTDVHRQR